MTETASSQSAAPHRSPDTAARSQLGTALRRARWTIFWERLWPALARLAAVVGLFLTVSWLGRVALAAAAGARSRIGRVCDPGARGDHSVCVLTRCPPPRTRCAGSIAAAGFVIARRRRSPTSSPSRRRTPIRSRCGRPMSSARWLRRAPSRPAGRRRVFRCATLMRCAVLFSSPSSPPSSPPAASIGGASRRHSTGRASCCRRISASTPGSRRRLIPASRRSFSPACIPARSRAQDAERERAGFGSGRFDADRARNRQAQSRCFRQGRRDAGDGRRRRRPPARKNIASRSRPPAPRRCAASART